MLPLRHEDPDIVPSGRVPPMRPRVTQTIGDDLQAIRTHCTSTGSRRLWKSSCDGLSQSVRFSAYGDVNFPAHTD
jgi:hypothetical protein